VGYLTVLALALFYVTAGIPLAVLVDKANRSNILASAPTAPPKYQIGGHLAPEDTHRGRVIATMLACEWVGARLVWYGTGGCVHRALQVATGALARSRR